MNIKSETFSVNTNSRNEMIDITSRVKKIVNNSGLKTGDVIIHIPHTTAAVTINENADPSVVNDILLTLNELIPHHRTGYTHAEGNSDSHVKSSIIGCTQQILLQDGSLKLGTWQGIYFCEFDGPRTRKVNIQIRGN